MKNFVFKTFNESTFDREQTNGCNFLLFQTYLKCSKLKEDRNLFIANHYLSLYLYIHLSCSYFLLFDAQENSFLYLAFRIYD